MLLSTGFVGKK